MSDLTTAISPKSDQLNYDDLIGSKTPTIKITKVNVLVSGDQRVILNYEGDNGKPYKPCKSMCRVLVHCWGSDGNAYVGRLLTLYGDPRVRFGKDEVGGIRISHMSHIKDSITMALTASKAVRKPFTVQPIITPDDALIEAGNKASTQGVAAYVAWRDGLTPAVRETIRPYNAAWSNVAKAADAAKEV